MSNQSFESAMNQIGVAAESQRKQEVTAQQRQKMYDRIRQVCLFLFSAAIVGAGFYYRQELQTYCSEKLGVGVGPKMNAETSKSLTALQEHAAKRDNVLEAIEK